MPTFPPGLDASRAQHTLGARAARDEGSSNLQESNTASSQVDGTPRGGHGLVVAGWWSFDYFEETSANDLTLGITLLVSVVAVFGVVLYFLQPRGFSDSNKLESNIWWLIPGVIALGFLVTAVSTGHNSRQPGGHLYS